MQNIQDLKEKIFFESKNIIDNLDKINNVDELLSKQDLVDELANRISFLRLLEKNIEYFIPQNVSQVFENQENVSFTAHDLDSHDSKNNEVTEEEAIFNNELNEIDENEEEEAIFNNQLNEIVENEFHENFVNFVEEDKELQAAETARNDIDNQNINSEKSFNDQLSEIEENQPSENVETNVNFVDEERILADSEPDNDENIHEEMFNQKTTEEEAIFNNQLNEIDELENEISDNQGNNLNNFQEEEKIQFSFEPEVKSEEKTFNEASVITETIPSIFDPEIVDDEEEILIEETEEQFVASNINISQGEMASETSNVENILSEIKNEAQLDEKQEEAYSSEANIRREIVEIDKPEPELKEKHPSDESFENTDEYHQERKIKLANIKGLKGVQTLFDDDPLEREIPVEKKQEPVIKEETGSILKTNIPTQFMEAAKPKPEFKLDLNDRIAFSKMLFGGSQSDLNDVVSVLNRFKNLEEAKEYLSDLYYERKWNKVDEYAQRLWILVENKFL